MDLDKFRFQGPPQFLFDMMGTSVYLSSVPKRLTGDGSMDYMFLATCGPQQMWVESKHKERIIAAFAQRGRVFLPGTHHQVFLLTPGTTSTGQLVQCLIGAGVTEIIVYSYGMKAPLYPYLDTECKMKDRARALKCSFQLELDFGWRLDREFQGDDQFLLSRVKAQEEVRTSRCGYGGPSHEEEEEARFLEIRQKG